MKIICTNLWNIILPNVKKTSNIITTKRWIIIKKRAGLILEYLSYLIIMNVGSNSTHKKE